jgi:hypothetical protein
MTKVSSLPQVITKLSADDAAVRTAGAEQIFKLGRGLAERAVAAWWADKELSQLLLGDRRVVTVGLAVQRETFARIREANGVPELAAVPPEQDAQEFELHFASGVLLDVLTCREPEGNGAIARFLGRFGEGIQQVEFLCLDVGRAATIISERFGVAAVYESARAGAGGTKINFFLMPLVGEPGGSGSKILIELYEVAGKQDCG